MKREPAQYNNRCVWLIGASSGIGKALALALAEKGNYVIASARSAAALNELALQGSGRIKPLIWDVQAPNANLSQTARELSTITDYVDTVIYCAGVCHYEDTLKFDPDKYQQSFEVNTLGAVKALHLALGLLKRSKLTPQVALVGSLSSAVGFPRAEAYGASKAALEYFAHALKADCSHLPLDVRIVRPGFVQTPMTAQNTFPMPWIIEPEEAASRIIEGLESRRFVIDFPRRLSWLLRFCGFWSGLWFNWIAPKITEHKPNRWQARQSPKDYYS